MRKCFGSLIILFVGMMCLGSSGCDLSVTGGDGGGNSDDDRDSENVNNIITNTEVESNGGEGDCDGLRFPDGPEFGTNLYEPEGSDEATVQIRFDARIFTRLFSSVQMFAIIEPIEGEEEFVEEGRVFTEVEFLVGDNDRDNQGRQVWTGSLPGESYTGKVVVEFVDGRVCDFVIDTPSVIVD